MKFNGLFYYHDESLVFKKQSLGNFNYILCINLMLSSDVLNP